jgi:pimeloyl-ACP methyl ester carboxylesterase
MRVAFDPRPRHRSGHRRVRRVMAALAAAVAGGSIGLVTLLIAWSYPGRPRPVVEQNGHPVPGSISEKISVDINGTQQGMFIRSRNATNPVLLFLHGGLPEYFLDLTHPTHLEDQFTVVWWEQRGAGLSFQADAPREAITAEQLIADTIELTNYLRARFHQEKIFLLAHSGGTFFGIRTVQRAPELYHAYIAESQMVNQRESERLAYEFMLRRFREIGDQRMVRMLEAAPVTNQSGTPPRYLALRDRAMHRLGVGTTHDMRSVVTGLFLPSWVSREYTLREKVRMWRGKAAAGVSPLWPEMLTTDLAKDVRQIRVPVYFLHGVYDQTCSYRLAKDYLADLDTPLKGFYTFVQSAHSPLFEEPGRVREIMTGDVLQGTNSLADENGPRGGEPSQ